MPRTTTPTIDPAITIRTATAADIATLHRLATLDETDAVLMPALIAEQDDRAVAALSLADGRIAADPFARTASVVELLRLRAERVDAASSRSGLLHVVRRQRRTTAARI